MHRVLLDDSAGERSLGGRTARARRSAALCGWLSDLAQHVPEILRTARTEALDRSDAGRLGSPEFAVSRKRLGKAM